MVEPWHSSISKELSDVESLMMSNLESDNAELTEMCRYVIGAGGKRLRPSLCILSYYMCGGKDPSVPIHIGSAFEIVHSATLIHDDINDMGEIRRGRKTLHKAYTTSKAIVAGDYMFAIGFRLLADVAPQVVGYVVDASSSMGSGEFIQKDYEHAVNVTEDEYIKIITGKTAKLFEAAAKSGAVVADDASIEKIDALGSFAHDIGLAFQIVDDTLDVTGDPNTTGKAVGTDLLEGKPTLPVIYAMQNPSFGKRIAELFEKPETTLDDVKEALSLIRATDAVSRCLEKAKIFINRACNHLSSFPDSIYKQSMLSLADYIVCRNR